MAECPELVAWWHAILRQYRTWPSGSVGPLLGCDPMQRCPVVNGGCAVPARAHRLMMLVVVSEADRGWQEAFVVALGPGYAMSGTTSLCDSTAHNVVVA
eukprot:45875-Rhodomonas_salina.4